MNHFEQKLFYFQSCKPPFEAYFKYAICHGTSMNWLMKNWITTTFSSQWMIKHFMGVLKSLSKWNIYNIWIRIFGIPRVYVCKRFKSASSPFSRNPTLSNSQPWVLKELQWKCMRKKVACKSEEQLSTTRQEYFDRSIFFFELNIVYKKAAVHKSILLFTLQTLWDCTCAMFFECKFNHWPSRASK